MSDSWKPSTTVEMLHFRAHVIKKIRIFFEHLGVLEVETPLLMPNPVTDPYIETFKVDTLYGQGYLQSSPEYAMKRLLAAGSGSIYQLSKAFRNEEKSSKHNFEFSMLEWYRVGIDHHQLMDEIKSLMQMLLPSIQFEMVTYGEIFEKFLGLNPHVEKLEALQNLVKEKVGEIQGLDLVTRYHALELLFSYCIEPYLEKDLFYFIYHYTKEQSALARVIETDEGKVAARFECFYQGLELANGYYELTDEIEQKKRFDSDLEIRENEAKVLVPIDHNLLAALKSGLPRCAGVALGLDRLIMGLSDAESISHVVSFC
ncbi:EF-P lysine aminoacylase GenX [Thiotrichales bacterium 19S3-7]|nr:EF-P lysine aminoacylase GenX [Thiotrichales bacterium 19S3-7]MCF6801395.1 EF-P lysine aminoacylase GenX [Thiotrichales bacterium 19S3-11]